MVMKIMEIKREDINGTAVLAISGRLNVTTTAVLEEALKKLFDEGSNKILIDCVALEYISSAGLRVLLAAAKTAKKAGGEISISGMSASVRQVFEISGFTTIFPIFDSKDEALNR